MTPRWVLSLALTTLSLVLPSLAPASEAEDGKRLYRVHCQACHGDSGQGDGPMKDQLEMMAPDLTTIAARNDGEFPTERIHQVIDGRQESLAHGTREMPVWGFTFQSTGRDTDQEQEIRGMVSALARYLESLQVESGAPPKTDDSRD